MILEGEGAQLDLGRRLASHVRIGDVIALEGGNGAGKTTLARGLLEGLGLEGEAPSPGRPSRGAASRDRARPVSRDGTGRRR